MKPTEERMIVIQQCNHEGDVLQADTYTVDEAREQLLDATKIYYHRVEPPRVPLVSNTVDHERYVGDMRALFGQKTPTHKSSIVPLKMHKITPDTKPKNGTTIFFRRLWLEVNGKLHKFDLCYFSGGDMRQGFSDSVHDPKSKAAIKVWKLQKDRVRAAIAASDRELLADEERQGMYEEEVGKIADDLVAAITAGEFTGHVSVLTEAAESVLLSPYRNALAFDTLRYSAAGKRLERLAGRLMLADIEAKLGEEPAYVDLWKGPTE